MAQIVTCPPAGCKLILSSACVFYEGPSLLNTDIKTNDSVEVVIQKIDEYLINNVGKTYNNYVHHQDIASSVWVINHNLGRKPSITVVDSADSVVGGKPEYLNNNTLRISFNASFVGKAYLN